MKILAIDLGRVKSVACDYASDTGEHSFQACQTVPAALEALFVRRQPDRVDALKLARLGDPHGSRARRSANPEHRERRSRVSKAASSVAG